VVAQVAELVVMEEASVLQQRQGLQVYLEMHLDKTGQEITHVAEKRVDNYHYSLLFVHMFL
jgi:hypothetical protein